MSQAIDKHDQARRPDDPGDAARSASRFRASGIGCLLALLALLYSGISLALYSEAPSADESWYYQTASDFAQGDFLSEARGEIVAPGYPLFLAGMLKSGFPLRAMKGVNVVLLLGGLWCFYRAARLFLPGRVALPATAAVGLHPLLLRWVAFLMTESFAFFCASAFVCCLCMLLQRRTLSWRILLATAAAFAALCLTRTLFAYVAVAGILACACGCAVALLIPKRDAAVPFLRAGSALILALLLCAPYLSLTRLHTGKFFYWSSYGGGLLYWVTSPYPDELGDWHSIEDVQDHPILASRHLEFLTATEALPLNQREAAYRGKAMENLRLHPAKLLRNWGNNVSRLFFGTPRSFMNERGQTHIYIWPHVCILVSAALSLVIAARCWRNVPPSLWILALLGATYLGGSALLPAMPRYLVPVLPIAALWLAFTFSQLVRWRPVLSDNPSSSV